MTIVLTISTTTMSSLSFRDLPAEMRLEIYKQISFEPKFIKFSDYYQCDRVATPTILHLDGESRVEATRYFRLAVGFRDKNNRNTQFFYNPSSTTFILPEELSTSLSRPRDEARGISPLYNELSYIQCVSVPWQIGSMWEYKDENASGQQSDRRNFLSHFISLKKLIFIQRGSGSRDLAEQVLMLSLNGTGLGQMFSKLRHSDRLGRYLEKCMRRVVTKDFEECFPDREVPLIEMVYLGDAFSGAEV